MSLTSLTFLGVYFPLLLLAYYNPFFRKNAFRKFLLLGASLGLYAFAEPVYFLLLLLVIVGNYLLVQMADYFQNNFFRGLAIALDAVLILGFKYINSLLGIAAGGSPFTRIAFPIGLSYFTFKAISYVVDSAKVKDGKFLDVAIYISNFLTIVSGPLVNYEEELPYIQTRTISDRDDAIYRGLERMILGLGKKVVIADTLAVLVNQCFADLELSFVMAWGGAIAYTLQLFFDFSGYTDLVLGAGYLFGFRLPENFNYPYMAVSVADFWKRWHMSLTRWFTRYIYIPLGGSRVKTAARHVFNLFVVWLVTGLWHGSALTFLVWAMIYFILQLLEKYTGWIDVLKKYHLGHIYTLLIVVIEWVIFRSESIFAAFSYLRAMFLLNGNALIHAGDAQILACYWIPFLLGIVFSTNIGMKIQQCKEKNLLCSLGYHLGLLVVFVACILMLISQGYTAPLYAGF